MSERQVALTVFAGMAAPMVLLCGAVAWPSALLGLSVAALGIQLTDGCAVPPRWLRGVYLLWCVLLMGKVADMSRACFQDETGFIPVVLLVLAAVAGRKPENCGRLGALLWPTVAALVAGMLAFAMSDFKWMRFASARGSAEAWMPITALALSPAVLRFGSGRDKGLRLGSLSACVFGFLVSTVCSGVLGSLQGELQQPLYDMVRGVSILGVAERLEALLSVALCIGSFLALCTLCAAGADMIREEEEDRREQWWVAVAALAVSRPVALLPGYVWLGFSCVLGVIVPLLIGKRTSEKIRGISKNNA